MPAPAHTRLLAATALLLAAPALADTRPFTFVYESTTMPPGAFEYEQWVTWKTDKDADSSFDQFDFRHELEFGVTDHFQLAVYVSDWSYAGGRSVTDDGATWKNIAVEGIYNLANPARDPFGLGLYGEVKVGDEVAALEGKLIIDKQVGDWAFAWNGIIEAEWEGSDYAEDKAEFGNVLGVSRGLGPSWRVGAELIHEVEYEDWSRWGDHVVYLGPNVSYRRGRVWFTVTPVLQVTDVADEANVMTRLIVGVNF